MFENVILSPYEMDKMIAEATAQNGLANSATSRDSSAIFAARSVSASNLVIIELLHRILKELKKKEEMS